MVARELNGLRKYLIGVGITVTGAAVIQIGLLLVWIGEARVRIQHLEAENQRQEQLIATCCKSASNDTG